MLKRNFQNIIFKNYSSVAKAKIQFLGKRSLLPKDFHKETTNIKVQPTTKIEENKTNNNSIINFSLNKNRTKISNEESEIINNGGPLVFPDWNKIKLKPKMKSNKL